METLSDVIKKSKDKGAETGQGQGRTAAQVREVELQSYRETGLEPRLPAEERRTVGGMEVEIECVMGGALMKVKFPHGVNPADVVPFLRGLDAGVQFRTEFPRAGAFGKKETKQARALVLNVDVRDAGKFVSITCQGATDDLTVSVGRKVVDEWEGKLKMLAKLTDRSLAKVAKAFAEKKSATVVLSAEEQFGVGYWSSEDGKHFLEEMTPEPPPPQAAGAGEGAGS